MIGLSIDEFWGLTLAEFNIHAEAYEIRCKKEDFRVALICSSIYNANRTKKDKLVKPEQFMPKSKMSKQESADNMLKVAEFLTHMKGGIDLRKGSADDDTG